MMTAEELNKVVEETKSLKTRTEAAEAKVKALEEEKATMIASKGYSPAGNRSDSDEARALRHFGVSHPKQLLDINTAHPRYAHVPAETKALVRNFKQAVDTARFSAQMFHGEPQDVIGRDESSDRIARVKGMLDTRVGKEILAPALKAFGSTVSGAGDEWVPTMVSSSYIPEYELDYVLENKFEMVNMPSNPFDMPKSTSVTKARIAAEGATKSAAQFGTQKISLNATKLVEYYEIPEELSEDSAPDFLAVARREVVLAQTRAAEAAIISGDNDGTHPDSDTQAGAADLAEKAWKGLRAIALANSATHDFGNAAVTHANLKSMRAKMAKYGSLPGDLLIISGPIVYQQLVGLDEVSTIEKFGPMATILKGALAAWQGIPVVNAEQFREDLNATGVYDGVTDTRAGIVMVNLKTFWLGQRRPIKVKVMPSLPSSDQWLMASYRRVDFKGFTQASNLKSVLYGYNIAK
jgi:HK97 family phage major capsid protein